MRKQVTRFILAAATSILMLQGFNSSAIIVASATIAGCGKSECDQKIEDFKDDCRAKGGKAKCDRTTELLVEKCECECQGGS